MKVIEILHRDTRAILVSGEYTSLRAAAEEKKANLRGANLTYANLRGANITGAKGFNPLRVTPLLLLLDQPAASRLRAYKLVNEKSEGHVKGGIRYAIGVQVQVIDANTGPNKQCGTGINVATLDWCMREWQPGYRILVVEFFRDDIACIPTATDGKFRLYRCTPVAEKDLVEIGLVSAEPVVTTTV